jgi:uncharacterized membrane protein
VKPVVFPCAIEANMLLTVLLWFCAVGCGLLGGLYFAFSAFIMQALDRAGHAHGIAAMNSINAIILRSWFMPMFLGTTLGAAALAIIGVIYRDHAGATLMLAGGTVYVLGMFIVTMAFNVPLNNALAKAEGAPDAAIVWQRYLTIWKRWNHVRTLSSVCASAMFIAALHSGK